MYGCYDIPLNLTEAGIEIKVERDQTGKTTYGRSGILGEVSKTIVSRENPKVVICPVEPVNLPKRITRYLMIELDKEVLLGPKDEGTIDTGFPVEIGVFIAKRDKYSLIDVFSFTKQKFSLYGGVRDGIICRYWRSGPNLNKDKLVEGRLRLQVKNDTSDWIEIRKVVLDASEMKIVYSEDEVYSEAEMKILSRKVGEVRFRKPANGGTESIKLLKEMVVTAHQSKFIMEDGFK